MVGLRPRLQVCEQGLRHPPTLSRGPAEGSTLSSFLKLFHTWTSTHGEGNALVTDDSIRVVGRERAELDSDHGKENVNQSIAVRTGLVKGIEKDKTVLDMVVTAG